MEYFKDVLREHLEKVIFHYRRCKDFKPVEDELRKRPHAVLIDGRLADGRFKEWDYADITATMTRFDMPMNLFSFAERIKLPGIVFIEKSMAEFIAEQLA